MVETSHLLKEIIVGNKEQMEIDLNKNHQKGLKKLQAIMQISKQHDKNSNINIKTRYDNSNPLHHYKYDEHTLQRYCNII